MSDRHDRRVGKAVSKLLAPLTQSSTLEELVRTASAMADILFEAYGEVEPLWLVEINGRTKVMSQPYAPPDMPGPVYKEMIFGQVRQFFREQNVARYVYLNEAWTVDTESIDPALGSLANHPTRREVVGMTAEDDNGALVVTREIVRPAHTKPFLRPLGKIERPEKLEGRQFGLLPQRARGS